MPPPRIRIGAALTLLLSCIAPCANAQSPQAPAYGGTAAMGALLRKIYAATDWKTDPTKQALRARYYQDLLNSQHLSVPDRLQVELQLAAELLQAGDSSKSVATIEGLRQEAAAAHLTLPAEFDLRVRKLAAISWFRLGEQENCLNMDPGTRRACIFPIDASGRHHRPRGAEGAVRELTQLLDLNPHDALSQWLLNVAFMQLGGYPQDVPPRWLIPAKLFDSEATIGAFENVAASAGLAVMGHAGGAVMDDFDGDGLLDIVVTSSGPLDPMHFFHNNGDGTFQDRTRQAGLADELGGLNLIAADYDNDGHTDLLVLRGGWWGRDGEYPFSLLRNRGDGTFEDVTAKAGLLSLAPTQTAAWADYDGDGWLDLFVGHESGTWPNASSGQNPDPRDRHPSQLFHNNHDGTFTEIGASLGLSDLGYVKGVAWGDFNNDGRPDLYVSSLDGPNHLFRNDGPQPHGRWKFTDVTREAGVAQPLHSFATWFFDYDNDGWPDLFVAGYSTESEGDVGAFEMQRPNQAELPRLYRNNRDGTFTDVTRRTHLDRAILVMGSSFGDLDNDGWLDVYLGTGDSTYTGLLPNRMFRNNQGRAFEDITTSGGFGHLQKGHSIIFGDPGNNGREDVFEEMGGALPGDTFTSVLYRNPGNGNHWIELELEGVKANRSAIGARLDLCFTDPAFTGNGARRHVYRTVGFGSSFGGNPLRQHIGLGQATVVRSLDVRWPGSGTVQHFTNIPADHIYHLREGSTPELQHLKSFPIGPRGKATLQTMPPTP